MNLALHCWKHILIPLRLPAQRENISNTLLIQSKSVYNPNQTTCLSDTQGQQIVLNNPLEQMDFWDYIVVSVHPLSEQHLRQARSFSGRGQLASRFSDLAYISAKTHCLSQHFGSQVPYLEPSPRWSSLLLSLSNAKYKSLTPHLPLQLDAWALHLSASSEKCIDTKEFVDSSMDSSGL